MKLKSYITKSIGWIGSAVIAAGVGYWIGRDHEHRDQLDARDEVHEKRSFTDLRGALEGHERPDDLGPPDPPGPPGTGAAGAAAAAAVTQQAQPANTTNLMVENTPRRGEEFARDMRELGRQRGDL
ncbi:hypothetical protein [Halococcus saccharolyticus]|uniref:Uncharacterized protein n=1 Tax=Halococcus saccharolyticus DSM 5350 TaxID=1227455 RepID=M0MA51_9EURY|nr:hypothetical protein [Halococcus saccharolyticus]EMA42667.1 hypothetical protein C449_16033 [Halococcus saccharolyticus DSM 5350]